MESGIIPDSSITASSFYSADCQPHYARLNRDLGLCAWLPEISPEWSWLQVDFGEKLIVLGLATQGSCRQNYWVKSYFVSYKEEHDALNWLVYTSYEGRPIVSASQVKYKIFLFISIQYACCSHPTRNN